MNKKLLGILLSLLLVPVLAAGCGKPQNIKEESIAEAEKENQDLIVIGFSQVGAESDWRKANTESIKETFTEEAGFQLIISDAQQKQTNQITAIRTFIQQEVDYIVLAPVTEDGWDTVLEEARDANIPVIIVDRMVNVSDDDLFVCRVGANFELEADKVCNWIKQYNDYRGIPQEEINIVAIKGTPGASSQLGRSQGLYNAVKKYGWNLMEEGDGEYTQARAREVMASMLRKYDNINIVYCENDNEAFGAIEAIEARGKRVGPNIKAGQIMIVSFDGVSEQALSFVRNSKIACIAECNPVQGPYIANIIRRLEKGEQPDKFEYVDGRVFSHVSKIGNVVAGDKLYPVTILE